MCTSKMSLDYVTNLYEGADHAILPMIPGLVPGGSNSCLAGALAGAHLAEEPDSAREVVAHVEGRGQHARAVLGQHLVALVLPDYYLGKIMFNTSDWKTTLLVHIMAGEIVAV